MAESPRKSPNDVVEDRKSPTEVVEARNDPTNVLEARKDPTNVVEAKHGRDAEPSKAPARPSGAVEAGRVTADGKPAAGGEPPRRVVESGDCAFFRTHSGRPEYHECARIQDIQYGRQETFRIPRQGAFETRIVLNIPNARAAS